MNATIFIPRDDPYGAVSLLVALAVAVTLANLARSPDRMSLRSKMFAAITTALLLSATVSVLCLRRESAHTDGIDEMEALVSFIVLVSGAFGAGLGCMRSNARWLVWVGLIASAVAGAVIVLVAVDIRVIFWLRVDTPVLTVATIVLVITAFTFRSVGLLLRSRRSGQG